MPYLPADLFAATAHLLEASGAYQYIVAPFPTQPSNDLSYDGPTFAPTQADLDSWCALGAAWRVDVGAATDIEPFWHHLWFHRAAILVDNPSSGHPPCAWWSHAHALMVIADEASCDLGYSTAPQAYGSGSSPIEWANAFASMYLDRHTDRRVIVDPTGSADDRHISRHVALDSLSLQVDRHVARVLPKGRTTEMGCAPRTFSHNLALMPPHGRANAYWHQAQTPAAPGDGLNLLLVPFPYILPDGSFRGVERPPTSGGRRWGRFKLDQRWLNPGAVTTIPDRWSTPASSASFVDFVDALIAASAARGMPPNGIVLPEYALDWETYDALARHLRDHHPSIEFLVSGVSRDCNGRAENQVTTTVFAKAPRSTDRVAQTHSRRKHHRWQVDKGQIETYGLQADLDPDVVWWEHLSVEERVLHLDVFRGGATLTAVICEDLARVDPGLALLRSLGPSLVFALLMDGPQLKFRWPGTYVTSLADDPGSSVLSMTSVALVDRSNAIWAPKNPGKDIRRTIALWKNRPKPGGPGTGLDFAEVDLDPGHHAVSIRLRGEPAFDTTIDGRANDDAMAWYLERKQSLGLDTAAITAGGWSWIVGTR